MVIEVIPPIEDLNDVVLVAGAHEHPASVPFRRGGAGGAGVTELLLHGAVVEESEAHAPHVVEERRRDAVVGDVERAPFLARPPDGFAGRVAEIWVEGGEVDGGNIVGCGGG